MGFGDWLTKGGFHITDDQRDPKSRLGRANPHSLHLRGDLYQKGFGTYDVRPRKGMTYEQYIDRIKADGWNIIQAQNEVKNPSRHATGPHWHVAVDGRKEQQPMASPLSDMLKNNPAFMPPQQQPGGSLASYLQAPITDEPLQKAVMPGDRPGFEMAPLPGVKPKGRGTANDIIGSLGDFLASAFGGQPQYWNGVNEQQQLETEGRQRLAQRQADREDKLAEAMRPRVEQIGNQFGILDPRTGGFDPTYTAPQDARTGETERLIAQWNELPDTDPRKAMIERALRGSSYDPRVYQPKEDYQTANRIQVKRTVPGKAPSVAKSANLPTGFILD